MLELILLNIFLISFCTKINAGTKNNTKKVVAIKPNTIVIEVFRIAIPTQEAIDEWQSRPSVHFDPPPQIDMVQEMWDKIGGRPDK